MSFIFSLGADTRNPSNSTISRQPTLIIKSKEKEVIFLSNKREKIIIKG
jgi:hypothetical protein